MITSYIITDSKEEIEFINRVIVLPETIKIISYDFFSKNQSSLVNNPKLLICFSKAKIFYEKINILSNKINKKTFWCDSKKDDLNEFRKNIELFIEQHSKLIFDDIIYSNNLSSFEEYDKIDKCYQNRRSIFFLKNKHILGIDKHFIAYTNNKSYQDKIKYYESITTNFIYDLDNELLNHYKKLFESVDDIVEKYILYLE